MTIDLLVKKADHLMTDFKAESATLWDPNEIIKKQIRLLLNKTPNLDQIDH